MTGRKRPKQFFLQLPGLPVVKDGKIVGAITRYDLLQVIRTLSAMP